MSVKIIILNGVGSAGKGSIARELQAILAEPFLHLQMDTFMNMQPERYDNHPDSFRYATVTEDGHPAVVIETGPVGERVLRGMRHAVAAMAAQGNNLIVDDVMLEDEPADYADLLAEFDVFFVSVTAPLDVLEARERQRGDRRIGLARWQFDRVHKGKTYDLEVDTSHTSPADCAALIKRKLRL